LIIKYFTIGERGVGKKVPLINKILVKKFPENNINRKEESIHTLTKMWFC
jgi:hypothetical protein